MIKCRITVSKVNYEESFRRLFPLIMKKTASMPDPGMAVRFINRMGEDSLPIVLSILSLMEESDKAALMASIVNQFRGHICASVNRHLKEYELGRALELGPIGASSRGEVIDLTAEGLKVDYRVLVESDAVQKGVDAYADKLGSKIGLDDGSIFSDMGKWALKKAAAFAPGQIEKKGIEIMSRSDVNAKLTETLSGALSKIGIWLTIDSITLERDDTRAAAPAPEDDAGFKLPLGVEESLIDSVATYLKSVKPGP